MIPLRDTIPSRTFPAVTLSLVAANLAVFVLTAMVPVEARIEAFHRYGLVPARFLARVLLDPEDPGGLGPLGFFTCMFLHGNLLHLAGNMWFLWLFGDNVEDRMGRPAFLLFYGACGVAAGGMHMFMNPSSTVPTIGASGAVAGVMGAYFLRFPHAMILVLVPFIVPLLLTIPAVVYLGIWFAWEFMGGTAVLMDRSRVMGIAFWAHVGGFVAGAVLQRFFPNRHRGHPLAERRMWSRGDRWWR